MVITPTRQGTIASLTTRAPNSSGAVFSISSDARKATVDTPSEDATDSMGFSNIEADRVLVLGDRASQPWTFQKR